MMGLKEPEKVTERRRVRDFREEVEKGCGNREMGDEDRGEKKHAQSTEGKQWSHANLH